MTSRGASYLISSLRSVLRTSNSTLQARLPLANSARAHPFVVISNNNGATGLIRRTFATTHHQEEEEDDENVGVEVEYEYIYEYEGAGENTTRTASEQRELQDEYETETPTTSITKQRTRQHNATTSLADTAATAAAGTLATTLQRQQHLQQPSSMVIPGANTMQRLIVSVEPKYAGHRLDKFLKVHLSEQPFSFVHKLIRKGDVYRLKNDNNNNNNKETRERLKDAAARMNKGDRICIFLPKTLSTTTSSSTLLEPKQKTKKQIKLTAAQEEELRSWVIFKNEHVIVLNKPSGIAVQGGSKTKIHIDGMLHALRFGYEEEPRLVHRLDKDTSGVLVLARTREAASRLGQWFRDHNQIKKCYWALVEGKPKPSSGRIKMPLTKATNDDGDDREVVMPAAYDEEETSRGSKVRMSITEYKTVDAVGDSVTWLALYPISGHTHQLRVHCARALNCAILGDYKYGTGCPDSIKPLLVGGDDERKGSSSAFDDSDSSGLIRRRHADKKRLLKLHLHAHKLALPYTDRDGRRVVVKAPLPKHMKETFEYLDLDEKDFKDKVLV